MNKKYLIIAGAVIVVLSGVFFWWSEKNKIVEQPIEKADQNTEVGTLSQDQSESAENGIAGWLSALSGGKALSCTYNFNESGQAAEVKMNMMGKKYRSEFESAGMKFTSVFDGQTLYSWSTEQKQGTKMDMNCMEQLKSQAQTADNSQSSQYEKSPEDFLKNRPDIRCSPTVGAANFSVPGDVQFVDRCAMMRESLDMMKQYQDKIPAGLSQ